MKLKKPVNENYAAIVVEIGAITNLPNCDNVASANLFSNSVIVGKDTIKGTKGIFFPTETKLSEDYLHSNNLYRDNTKNKDVNEKGYFEENGRIKCMKFRGHKSEGLFMPIGSLLYAAEAKDLAQLKVGDTFDELHGIAVCEKYIPRTNPSNRGSGDGQQKKTRAKSRIVDKQFAFHPDTNHLGRNMFKIEPDTILSISNKLHGSSFIVGNVLCSKPLSLVEKTLKWTGVKVVDTKYDLIWSSRKVIKNDGGNYNHYYKEDIWAEVAKYLAPYTPEGVTYYGEIVGFTPSGAYIQANYDYGCVPMDLGKIKDASFGANFTEYTEGVNFAVYIYRITVTNIFGHVIELSPKMVQNYCKAKGLKAVPEFFYGKARDFLPVGAMSEEEWRGELLQRLMIYYNMEKDCELCKNKVPAEGIVVMIEGVEYEAYKQKSFRFKEYETKQLDKGIVDMETQESQEQ